MVAFCRLFLAAASLVASFTLQGCQSDQEAWWEKFSHGLEQAKGVAEKAKKHTEAEVALARANKHSANNPEVMRNAKDLLTQVHAKAAETAAAVANATNLGNLEQKAAAALAEVMEDDVLFTHNAMERKKDFELEKNRFKVHKTLANAVSLKTANSVMDKAKKEKIECEKGALVKAKELLEDSKKKATAGLLVATESARKTKKAAVDGAENLFRTTDQRLFVDGEEIAPTFNSMMYYSGLVSLVVISFSCGALALRKFVLNRMSHEGTPAGSIEDGLE